MNAEADQSAWAYRTTSPTWRAIPPQAAAVKKNAAHALQRKGRPTHPSMHGKTTGKNKTGDLEKAAKTKATQAAIEDPRR